MAKKPEPTFEDAMAIISAAISALTDAYRAANNMDDKDRIFSVMSVLQDESSAIVKAGLASNKGIFKAQSQFFTNAKSRIEQFQKEIDTIVKYLQIAGQVADALVKVAMLL